MTTPVQYRLDAFPPKNIDWGRLIPLLGPAHAALARYDGLVSVIPNAKVMLDPLITQEAVLSSRIEGTTATMSEVLAIEAGTNGKSFPPSIRDDAEEIKNYCVALNYAADVLTHQPFSLDLLCQAHGCLMDGVRGRDKSPGSLRERQNWIGPIGSGIESARFVPIPQKHLKKGVTKWLHYVLDDGTPDPLVQLAIIHMEFEALHPFRDGNGRIGRMLVPLLLFSKGLLSSPNFYFSAYLEDRREEYFWALLEVSRDGAWTEWCEFFLEGLTRQADENHRKAKLILDSHRRMMRDIVQYSRSPHSTRAVEFLFSRPVFSIGQFSQEVGVLPRTAARLLAPFLKKGILRVDQKQTGSTPAVYSFPSLLDIIQS